MSDSGSTFRRLRLAGALCGALVLTLGVRAHADEPAAKPKKAPATAAKAETGPATPPADSSPKAELKKSNDQLKKVLQKTPTGRDGRNSVEVRKVVGQFLDFEELAHRALARNWDEITPKQRTEFVSTLRDLVQQNYLKQIHGKPDYDLRFDKESKEDREATVDATLLTTSAKGKKVNVAMQYKMIYKGGHWVVYDVITDEQSLLENYRAEFNKIISKDGFDALLKRMRKKLEEKTE